VTGRGAAIDVGIATARGDIERIAASAGREELDILEDIRLKCMTIPSDMGHKWFRRWSDVIKIISRRHE